MAKIHCSFSGLHLNCDHVPMTLALGEGAHPIFYLPQKKLLGLYSKYCKNHLTDKDSYLLFVALLNTTDSVKFAVPAIYTPSAPGIVARNIGKLVRVIWETDAISIPSFTQPQFYIRAETADLTNVDAWIAAWDQNIKDFKSDYKDSMVWEDLKKAENKLTYLIKSSAKDAKYATGVATWASKAAEFPPAQANEWEAIIRKSFNPNAMFSTPKATIKNIKEFCEENIEVGTIHFHALMETLDTAVKNHCDFLGLWDVGESIKGKESPDEQKSRAAALATEEEYKQGIIAKAPDRCPAENEYPSKIAYLRAKMAWDMKQRADEEAWMVSVALGKVEEKGDE